MRRPLGFFIIASILAVAGCADQGLRVVRGQGSGPDEFAVLPVKPLTAPADYAVLPAPTPGGANLTDPTPKTDAVLALGGRPQSESAGIPSSEAALVQASSRYGVAANTREVLAQEDAEFRRKKGRFTNIRVFAVDRYSQAYSGQEIDPQAAQDAYRRAGLPTPSAPPRTE